MLLSRSSVKKVLAVSSLGMLALLPATRAEAASANASLTVSATVLGDCTVSTSPLAFGNYTTDAVANLAATGQILVTCGAAQNLTITISHGSSYSATSGRRMSEVSGGRLMFTLYQDAALTTGWGNGTDPAMGTALVYNHLGGLVQDAIPVYGVIPALQFVSPGSYTQTLTATIQY